MAKRKAKEYEQSELLPHTTPRYDSLSPLVDSIHIVFGDALAHYATWPRPTVIISDGPYGVGGFPGDPPTPTGLPGWYQAHIAAWSRYALPETTLWFWCTEIGWATTHPVFEKFGWEYRGAHVWDKGVAHIAGNVNSKTVRGFPVVTELCVRYVRTVELPAPSSPALPLQRWLRNEWLRTGLPLNLTNEACGVKNAATRKYFTADHLWYFPPPDTMQRLAAYANEHGTATTWPYFSLDGHTPVTSEAWSRLRAKWHHSHGITNVWSEPAVRGVERLKDERAKCIHANQKPLRLVERIIRASSDENDVVWEPFGGLCSGAIASLRTQRTCYSAEVLPEYYALAAERLAHEGSRHVQFRTA